MAKPMPLQPTRPALRYYGGKWRLAPWVIAHFPPHRVYVEPFGGAASVLMRKPRTYAEVYNDKWGRVVDVFRVLRDPKLAKRLRRAVELTPYARVEFEATGEDELSRVGDVVERARRVILRSFAGHGATSVCGLSGSGFRKNTSRRGTTPASDWTTWPACVPAFVERLRGVTIENREAVDVMREHDGPRTLHYVDPPYLPDTRNLHGSSAAYAIEMNHDGHGRLAEVLHGLKGLVVLSGYPHPLYDRLYAGWRRYEVKSFTDKSSPRTECLWLNPACSAELGHGPLFAERFEGDRLRESV